MLFLAALVPKGETCFAPTGTHLLVVITYFATTIDSI